jgi:hypothetical protein
MFFEAAGSCAGVAARVPAAARAAIAMRDAEKRTAKILVILLFLSTRRL